MKKSELIWALCEVDEDLVLMAKEDLGMNTCKKYRGARWLRIGICVAVIAALFAVTAIAAYENNWFGFHDVFGAESNLIEDYVVVVDPETENADTDIVAKERTYTQQEQSLIEAGMMTVPEQAELSDVGVQATTENYCYTLEEMVVSEDTFMAILKVEALNEESKPRMDKEWTKGVDEFFAVFALNITGENGRERELKNGGLACDVLQVNDGVGYYLICNSGGQFATGDRIRFEEQWEGVSLFEVSITKLLDTAITMEVEANGFTSISVTPLSLALNGYSGKVAFQEAAVTLKDGTVIELAAMNNEFSCTDYGTYGALHTSGSIDPRTGYGIYIWAFSRLIDPEQVEKVTINGIDYNVES